MSHAEKDRFVDIGAFAKPELVVWPTRVGPHIVQDAPIGTGGYSGVHLGLHADPPYVSALKISSNETIDFQKEADLLEQLNLLDDLHIPRFYSVLRRIQTKNGPRDCLVMQYIDGYTVADVIEQKISSIPRLTLSLASSLIAPIASTVYNAFIHVDLVHRDIKPANILVDQNTISPYLTDFGTARDVMDSSEAQGILFQPPEVLDDLRNATHSSDIYSLGVVLYELVTGGNYPFMIVTKETTNEEKIRAIVKNKHKRISEYPQFVQLWSSQTVKALDAIFDATLAKNPIDRYQTANMLADALLQIPLDREK